MARRSKSTVAPAGRPNWLLLAAAEAVSLLVAWGLWAGGLLAAPGLASPNSTGNLAVVVVLEAAAALVCLLVPAWVAHKTGARSWWLVGVVPAMIPVATAVGVLSGWY